MSNSQVDSTGLMVAVAAAALSLMLFSGGQFDWLGSICGLAVFFTLIGYDREGYRSVLESVGFAATVSLSLTVASTIILRVFAGSMAQPAPIAGRVGSEWMPAIWLFVTVVFYLIDRARMGARMPQTATPPTSFRPTVFTPPPAPVAPPEPPRPVIKETPPPPVATPGPRPAFTQPTFSLREPEPAPAPAAPSPAQQVAAVPPPPAPVAQESRYASPEPTPTAPPPQVAPAAPGKEALIYVTLVGEGLNVLRAVQAEHLGRDYYRIVEPMPEGELWQYGPGQVVRCKKKNLSSGKAMVAYEEAQRSS